MEISVEITSEILNLIARIDEFKGKWNALKKLSPERLSQLKHVATIESIGSSTRIEGAKLSDQEVEALLSNIKSHQFTSRDEEEVAGYADAMELIFNSYEEITLTENHIKQLHTELLKFSSKDVRHKGEYKTIPNTVEAFDVNGESLGVVFETATPFETPRKMKDLVQWTQENLETHHMHPLLVIAVYIVHFLAIHPFQDGNGRLSRILTTLLLLRSGYQYVPYSSLESIVEENKDQYYLALRRTQQTLQEESPNWNPWNLFFLKKLKKQTENLSERIKQEKLLIELSQLSLKILEITKERGRVQISELQKLTKANRSTIKVHLKDLVQQQYLVKHGKGRGVWYSL